MKRIFYILFFVSMLFSTDALAFSSADNASVEFIDSNTFDFNLEVKNEQIEITWDDFPKNIKDYSIQRSFDGKRFSNILKSNTITQNFYQDLIYSFPVDKMYYRFVFTLEDDVSIISSSKVISLSKKNHLEAKVFVSGGQIDFSFNSDYAGMTSVQVFNNVGNLITEEVVSAVKGNNNHSLTVYGIRNGMYFLRLAQDTNATTTKFFIR